MIAESPLETLRESVAARIRSMGGISDIPVLTRKTDDFLNRIEELAAETGMIILVHLLSARELNYQAVATTYEARIMIQVIENPSLWRVSEHRAGGWSIAAAVESWIKLAGIQVGNQQALLQQERELEEDATSGGLFIVAGIYNCKITGNPRTTT
jgi:hypothetical protein